MPRAKATSAATVTGALGGGRKSPSSGATGSATHNGGGTSVGLGAGRAPDGAAADKTGYGRSYGTNDLR